MKIKGTEWYTACGIKFTPIEGSERVELQKFYGYRIPVQDKNSKELNELITLLKTDNVNVKLKTSKHDHTGIPKGTPYLQVLDEKSAIALERIFLEQGITLSPDRYKEYGLKYINRTQNEKLNSSLKKSFLNCLFERK